VGEEEEEEGMVVVVVGGRICSSRFLRQRGALARWAGHFSSRGWRRSGRRIVRARVGERASSELRKEDRWCDGIC
jgi:hypothetical protein